MLMLHTEVDIDTIDGDQVERRIDDGDDGNSVSSDLQNGLSHRRCVHPA